MASEDADAPMNRFPSLDGPLDALDVSVRAVGRAVSDRHPALRNALVRGRDAYARAYVWAVARANGVRYEAPVEPYRFLDVDPAAIEYVAEFDEPAFRLAGVVAGGDWDETEYRFAEMDVYRAYERHFVDGVAWTETAFFERVLDEIEEGWAPWGCTSRREFETRCARLDDLYATVRDRGYRTQTELLAAGSDDPVKRPKRLKTERLKDEIAVHVDRNGELLFEEGRNRLSIAKLLELETVPVRVLLRHREWQAVRDAYVTGLVERTDALDSHPDLSYLTYGSQ